MTNCTCTCSISSFLRRAFKPSPQELTDKTLASFLRGDDVAFVGHIRPEDTSLYDRYKELAKAYRDRFSFGISGPLQGQSAIRCRNNIDDEQHSTTELGTVEALEDFVKLCSTPLVPEITRRNEAEYSQARPLLTSILSPFLGKIQRNTEA